MFNELRTIRTTRGTKGLILFLKVASVALQQAASGHLHPDIQDVGMRISRTRSGLPRIIPAQHRIFIRNRNMGYTVLIRFYLTVFSVYRVIPMVGKPKLNTITDAGVYFDLNRYDAYISKFLELFIRDDTRRLIPRFYFERVSKCFSIYKSSPQSSLVRDNPFEKLSLKGM